MFVAVVIHPNERVVVLYPIGDMSRERSAVGGWVRVRLARCVFLSVNSKVL